MGYPTENSAATLLVDRPSWTLPHCASRLEAHGCSTKRNIRVRDQLLRRKKCACWGLSKVNRTSRDYVTYRKYGKWKRLTKLPRASRLTSRRSCHEEDLSTFNALGIFQSVQANRPQKAKESEVQQRDEDVPDEEKRKDQGLLCLTYSSHGLPVHSNGSLNDCFTSQAHNKSR